MSANRSREVTGESRADHNPPVRLAAARASRDASAVCVASGLEASEVWERALSSYSLELRAANRSPGTIKLRTHYLRRLARHYAGRGPWQLTAEELVEWLAGPEWRAETRKSARAALVTFYRWAVDTERIDTDPTARLAPVRVPPGAPRPVPTEILREAFARARTDRDRLILLFAAYAGLRRAEIARVRPGDFTHDGLVVRGKGGRERIVPVHPELAAAVRRELELRARGSHGSGWRFPSAITLEGPLFPGRFGNGLTPDNVGRVLSRLLGSGWSGHTLRHRFASSAYAAERDLRAVQELLGHSRPETTARYVQTPTEAKRTAVLSVTA